MPDLSDAAPDGAEDVCSAAALTTDPPTSVDMRRYRSARHTARLRMETIDDMRRAGLRSAFREELAAMVRSASPVLIGLLEADGQSFDKVVGRFEPPRGWPRRPRASPGKAAAGAGPHMFRHYLASLRSPGWKPPLRNDVTYVEPLDLAGFTWANAVVVGHSLEFEGRTGPVGIETRFGLLRLELDGYLPETIAMASVGLPVGAIVDHAVLRDRAWPITAVEEPCQPFLGQVVVATTGSVQYRMPWAR